MYIPIGIATIGLLRFLPLCTGAPAAPSSNRNGQTTTKQSASDACKDPSSTGVTSSCWTALKMDDYFGSWTNKTVMSNAPMIGTMYCRPNEKWAQCFIRFAYGMQRQTGPPMDCTTLQSTTCTAPSDMVQKPTSPEFWYGVYAIYAALAVFSYMKNLSTALLSTTARPGMLQSAYTSANAGGGAASGPNPIDATILQLLFMNGLTDMDIAFASYMKQSPYAGDFSQSATDPPGDDVIYKDLAEALQQRLQKLMNGWANFQVVLAKGGIWTGQVQGAAEFVSKWTNPGTTATTATTAQARM
ncbi:MAG: hypothetical protein Q9219_005483 [cf. Caloplaca sp. 3 TL-2023]